MAQRISDLHAVRPHSGPRFRASGTEGLQNAEVLFRLLRKVMVFHLSQPPRPAGADDA